MNDYNKMQSIIVPLIQKQIKNQKESKSRVYENSISLSKFTQEKLTEKLCIISGERGNTKLMKYFNNGCIQNLESKNNNKNKKAPLIMKPTIKQEAIHSSTSRILLIGGDFGTGKTHMLKLKACIHAKKEEKNKVAYLNLSSIDTKTPTCEQLRVFSLMYKIDKHHFKKHENIIDVFTAKHLIDHEHHTDKEACQNEKLNIYNLIKTFIEKKNEQHYSLICIDELPVPSSKDEEFDSLLKRKESVCAALKVKTGGILDVIPDKLDIPGGFEFIKLEYNFRNSEHVFNVSCALGLGDNNKVIKERYLNPTKTVSGPLNYHFHNNKQVDCVDLVKAVMFKYFKNHTKEPIVIIFDKIEETLLNEYNEKLQKHLSEKGYKVYSITEQLDTENVMEEINQDIGTILLTDIISFNGAQARNTIIFQNEEMYDEQSLLRNLILRTQCFTIVIHKTDAIRKISGLITDLDLETYIR